MNVEKERKIDPRKEGEGERRKREKEEEEKERERKEEKEGERRRRKQRQRQIERRTENKCTHIDYKSYLVSLSLLKVIQKP